MKQIKVKSSTYPQKTMSYNAWCKKYKIGSRVTKKDSKDYYQQGEYDIEKLHKIIKGYDKQNTHANIFRQAIETLLTLCKGQVQKTWDKIGLA